MANFQKIVSAQYILVIIIIADIIILGSSKINKYCFQIFKISACSIESFTMQKNLFLNLDLRVGEINGIKDTTGTPCWERELDNF